MQNDMEIKNKTVTKLLRAEGCVVLCGRVTYPYMTGEGEEIQRFNEAYESIAQAFLTQGILIPKAEAEKEWVAYQKEGRHGFARWELLCKMTAWGMSPPPCQQGRKKNGEDTAQMLVRVYIETTARRKYGDSVKKPFSCQHIWRFPQGILLTERELVATWGASWQDVLGFENHA